MADYLTTDTEITSIADALRTASRTSSPIAYPNGFISLLNQGTIVDLSESTATASDVMAGKKLYSPSGDLVTGTLNYMEQSSVTVSGNTITVPAGIWKNDVHIHMTGWQWDNLRFTMSDVITNGATGYSID